MPVGRILRLFGSVAVVLLVSGWLGFQVSPASYPPYGEPI